MCTIVRNSETLIHSIKHRYYNLGRISHMLHDNDMIFLLIYNSSTGYRGGRRL